MNQIISICFLIAGITLIILGVRAMESFTSDISAFFTGAPTDKAIWMLVAGLVLSGAGLSGAVWLRPRR